MNDAEKRIIFLLYKKGINNFSQFDKLLIESNPEIKMELDKLFNIDLKVQNEISNQVEKSLLPQKAEKRRDKKSNFSLFISLPAAAIVIILFSFIFRYIFPPQTLGGSIALFVSPVDNPDYFYAQGDTFKKNAQIKLAFQPAAGKQKNRQGILFSIDSNFMSKIYYHYHNETERINQRAPTHIEPAIKLDDTIEYIYFFIVFSETTFDNQEFIERITQIIKTKKLKAGRFLKKQFKNKTATFIYLKRENL